ncbi:MAG: hypothetical protein KF784_04140 [Fimbriimonadaceae bacterium]|nr:hypothetical protein [Fimbriimonadaceae bacterium]
MNPIQTFETTLVKIWTSEESGVEKAKRLHGVGFAIQRYVRRVRDQAKTEENQDLFKTRARERALNYLESLASECRFLAFVCSDAKAATAKN